MASGRAGALFFAQIGRFAASGMVNTALGASIILLLTWLGVNYVVANASGYAAGLGISFILNKHWTFQGEGSRDREILRFAIVFVASYLVNIGLVSVSIIVFKFGDLWSQLAGICAYAVMSFLGMKYVVFAPGRQA